MIISLDKAIAGLSPTVLNAALITAACVLTAIAFSGATNRTKALVLAYVLL